MILTPHSKINLGLQILRLRPDGYRDIRTVMLPIPLCDALEAVVDLNVASGTCVLSHSGLPVPGEAGQDLCLKAFKALAGIRVLPGLRMHLHKAIPIGGGLGGGSSDAAHALLLLDQLLDLKLDHSTLRTLAEGLGSDCAFFLKGHPQLVEGRGEKLTPVRSELSGWWLALLNPGVHVSTAEVYAHTPAQLNEEDLRSVVEQGPLHWADRLKNDMEAYVFGAYPVVAQMKEALEAAGAVYASMSGSGATVYGFFRSEPDLNHLGTAVILQTKL